MTILCEDHDFVKKAFYALGVIAMRTESGEFKLMLDTLKAIDKVLQDPKVYTDDQGKVHYCVDAALGCLSKIVFQHGKANMGIVTPSIVKGFLKRLPIVNDWEEAKRVHWQLLHELDNAVFAVHVQTLKETVKRIQKDSDKKPEIISKKGKKLLSEVLHTL